MAGKKIHKLYDPLQIELCIPQLTLSGEDYFFGDILTMEKRKAVEVARKGWAKVAPGKLDPQRSANLFIHLSENTGIAIDSKKEEEPATEEREEEPARKTPSPVNVRRKRGRKGSV